MIPFARIFRWLLVIALLTGLGLAVWSRMRPQPVRVVVHTVEFGMVERLVANTRAGTVKACRQADLSPGVGGQITRLPAKKGDRVSAGALLVEIWNDNLSAQIELTKSEGRAAAARATALRRQMEKADRDAERLKKLHGKAMSSDQDLDTALTQLAIYQSEHAAALADENTSSDRLLVLASEFERTRLLAPFAGVIAEVNGELNEYVTPSPPGIPTPPVVILLDTSCFYVSAPIDEVDAEAIKVDMPTRVSLDAFGTRSFGGRVRQIDPYVLDREKQARTVQVEVTFNTPAETENFLAGYSADVEIVIDSRANVLRIPSQAILDGKRVFVFDPIDRRLHERKISTGLANWEVTEVVSGLKAGEQVVVSTDLPGIKDMAAAISGGTGP
jgi:HlyD family secretion protein